MKPAPATIRRRRAFRRGHAAETLVAWYLRAKGYRVLERRYACALGEIDLIVRRGRTVAFVEVKARRDHGLAIEAVSPRQRRRIVQAARAWLATARLPDGCDLRFDVIVLNASGLPRHLQNAFGEE